MKFWEAMKLLYAGVPVKRIDLNQPLRPEDIESSEYEADFTTEWELYEEPPKTYSFMEIVAGMREGRRFVRKDHASDMALFVIGHEIYPRSQYGIANLKMEDFEATDWVEVKS